MYCKQFLIYPLVEASSSLSDIVITETAGDGVSWIVIVCCLLLIYKTFSKQYYNYLHILKLN